MGDGIDEAAINQPHSTSDRRLAENAAGIAMP